MRLGFLSSHSGTTMEAVLKAIHNGRLAAEPALLISNNSKSRSVELAAEYGMPFYHISQKTHPEFDRNDEAILDKLREHEVDIVLLVGYMKKLGPQTLKAYSGKIINIHPSLLPKYGGLGMYGHYVHEAVLQHNETESGVTIHLVDEDYDTGAIINQRSTPVYATDTIESLSSRVLELGYETLVDTLSQIAAGEVVL